MSMFLGGMNHRIIRMPFCQKARYNKISVHKTSEVARIDSFFVRVIQQLELSSGCCCCCCCAAAAAAAAASDM
jgi:hypothetical protein